MVGLFMFYLGGNAGKSNIEVHDVQFAAVEQIEEAFPLLRAVWFGDKDKIHLDGYMRIDWADGYDIRLSTQPGSGDKRLYFVNMGGYRSDALAEQHEFGLFVAGSAQEAKQKAKESLLRDMAKQHKDNLKEVDDCLVLYSVNGYYLHLHENAQGTPALPQWQGYLPIGENSD
ncbi:DUF1543 domain-containing protein [Affinibrenneria salicis]|uniref:DUF1543 domain-containing protein n=1 Tax=Affinibrenneria salicis TaxID=2590031 RepID=A0A5J5FYU3_9GAMM|nr:DUF1543 domain-containing protein [Affinibrenneria salicis]KAA8998948.1 DUF1543 domain-containing protein [Affinibrenneria salicis]